MLQLLRHWTLKNIPSIESFTKYYFEYIQHAKIPYIVHDQVHPMIIWYRICVLQNIVASMIQSIGFWMMCVCVFERE